MTWQYQHPLRKWQSEALRVWLPEQRGIVRVVTGAGKTAFAETCIQEFARITPEATIVIVVPTQVLLDQWHVSLRDDLGVDADDIAVFSGEHKSASVKPVNIIVLNTSRNWRYRDAVSSYSMLVVDECHRAASPENQSILAADWRATLGLSATPEREYDRGFEEALVPALGPVIFDYSYAQALEDGVIVPFEILNVHVPLLAHEQEAYERVTKKISALMRSRAAPEAKEALAVRLLQRRSAVAAKASLRIPTSVALAEKEQSGRTIVFHEFVAAAEQIAAILRARGAKVATYHSRLSDSLRRDNLRLFRRGLFDVLVTCRALDEGANVPEASTAIIASATRSTRQRIQRLGRVLRPARGKDAARVYTIFATPAEREQLEREEDLMEGISRVTWQEASVR